jgi:hypothetical protein
MLHANNGGAKRKQPNPFENVCMFELPTRAKNFYIRISEHTKILYLKEFPQ